MLGQRKPPLNPDEFTQYYAEVAERELTEATITIKGTLEVQVDWGNDDVHQNFLDNCYDLYLQGENLAEVVGFYIYRLRELRELDTTSIDRDLVVPVVKDQAWVTGAESMGEEGVKFLKRQLNAELVVVYAEDLPSQLRYLGEDNLEEIEVSLEELPQLAANNLMRVLPEWEIHGSDGFYMVTAGGTYEASLIAVPEFWQRAELQVKGDYVVGIPSRDLLLVTGSENPADVARLRAMVKERFPELSYQLTQEIFLVKDGEVMIYEG